jgi:Ca2+-binding RTX toxin-like protein
MLFLAGLMGMMLVGATVIVGTGGDDDTENDPQEPAGQDVGNGNLLDQIDGSIQAGTPDADAMTGTDALDQMGGYSGDDTILAGADGDYVIGADGEDDLDGQSGDDDVHGGYGADLVQGSSGDDALFGHMGKDLILGGAGADQMHGGDGDDTLNGGSGDDAVHGGLGQDEVEGGAGQDTLFGGWGDDWLSGLTARLQAEDALAEETAETDFLNGGGGEDTMVGGAGDIVTTGEGADQVVLGDWIGLDDPSATLMDFESGEDQLILVYNDATQSDPDIRIDADDESTRVSMNGTLVATLVAGTKIDLSDIALVPESAADAFLFRAS